MYFNCICILQACIRTSTFLILINLYNDKNISFTCWLPKWLLNTQSFQAQKSYHNDLVIQAVPVPTLQCTKTPQTYSIIQKNCRIKFRRNSSTSCTLFFINTMLNTKSECLIIFRAQWPIRRFLWPAINKCNSVEDHWYY